MKDHLIAQTVNNLASKLKVTPFNQHRAVLSNILTPLLRDPSQSNGVRLSKDEYALRLAETAALRSEDPFYQVGAVGLTGAGRVIATAYNGLLPGVTMDEDWWNDKEGRKPFMIHAEQNLCSLFTLGDKVELVAVTLEPCPDCMRLLMAHGVKDVIFRHKHAGSIFSENLARFYNVNLTHIPSAPSNP